MDQTRFGPAERYRKEEGVADEMHLEVVLSGPAHALRAEHVHHRRYYEPPLTRKAIPSLLTIRPGSRSGGKASLVTTPVFGLTLRQWLYGVDWLPEFLARCGNGS